MIFQHQQTLRIYYFKHVFFAKLILLFHFWKLKIFLLYLQNESFRLFCDNFLRIKSQITYNCKIFQKYPMIMMIKKNFTELQSIKKLSRIVRLIWKFKYLLGKKQCFRYFEFKNHQVWFSFRRMWEKICCHIYLF